jgi:hypothetical protein
MFSDYFYYDSFLLYPDPQFDDFFYSRWNKKKSGQVTALKFWLCPLFLMLNTIQSFFLKICKFPHEGAPYFWNQPMSSNTLSLEQFKFRDKVVC